MQIKMAYFILMLLVATAGVQAVGPVMSDVFTAAADGFKSIRIPSIVLSPHGQLIAFAEGRKSDSDQAENKIISKRSSDNGLTWTTCATLVDDGENSLNNPTAVVDQTTGRIFLMYQRIPAHMSEASKQIATGLDGPLIYRNFLITSDDDGLTWSKPLDVTRMTKRPTGATSVAVGPGIGIQLTRGQHKGRLIFPFNEGPFYKWNNFVVYSDDHGKTWRIGGNVPSNMLGKRSMLNEVQVVELEDGSVMLNSRQFAGAKCRKISVSHDGGETWSPVEDAKELRDPSCMASIFRYSFASDDGKSIAGKSVDAKLGTILYSGPDAKKRENGTLYVSHDDGKTWPVKKTLVPGSFSYSVLVKLPDAEIGCLLESEGKIRFARFGMEWVVSN